MAFELALEAPDLVAAIAPVAPLPFQPRGPWRLFCHPRPGHERVSIAMLGATHDRFVSYAPGGSPEYPNARYPGMEATRDAWLAALRMAARRPSTRSPTPSRAIPTRPHGPRHQHHRAPPLSPRPRRPGALVLQGRRHGPLVADPTQIWPGLWERFGKTNQDIDFAEEAWTFFKRHPKRPPSR